ncbi:MAG: hypothetical protein ABJD11_05760 [Gemmatimonadota bacterium]
MNRFPIRFMVLLGLNLMGTETLGWWPVPVIAALWAGLSPRFQATGSPARNALTSAAAAAVSWAVLLGWGAVHGPAAGLARQLGEIMHVPVWGLLAINLLFPAALAGSAAWLAGLAGMGFRGGWRRVPVSS